MGELILLDIGAGGQREDVDWISIGVEERSLETALIKSVGGAHFVEKSSEPATLQGVQAIGLKCFILWRVKGHETKFLLKQAIPLANRVFAPRVRRAARPGARASSLES
jgi:hypothetical protein